MSVTIYTRSFCGYCDRALRLLNEKGVTFHQIDAGMNPAKKKEMIQRANGGSTFPQIFVDDMHVGGCEELLSLDRKGQLDQLLQVAQ